MKYPYQYRLSFQETTYDFIVFEDIQQIIVEKNQSELYKMSFDEAELLILQLKSITEFD